MRTGDDSTSPVTWAGDAAGFGTRVFSATPPEARFSNDVNQPMYDGTLLIQQRQVHCVVRLGDPLSAPIYSADQGEQRE